ncbi:epidermal differentiation-specific protein-like [Struthio camelus]|uniref:epidermal differentiation-specific protein-like n=1 Tax=Struthio camelus TaxID=8801 RepID=UPI003603C4D0
MNRITVYERADFEGLSREFSCDVPDLHELDFGDCIASLKVVGQPWIAYTGPKYEGEAHAFEEGEYPAVGRPRSFSALRLVHHDLAEPQITLYERPHFQGARKVVTEETNLAYGYFNDRVASHVVQRGVWLLYQHPGGGGRHCLAWPGERLARYEPELGLQGRLSHLRPLRPGKPLVSARLLWERQRVEAEREVLVDEIVGVNETGREQALAASSAREYSTALWQSFRFSNATSLKAGLSFALAVEAANVFTVHKGRSECSTRRERVVVQLPATVPPRAALTVHVLRKEVTLSVPVLLTITQNESVRTELGEYRSISGTNVCARYSVKPLPAPGTQQAPAAGDGGDAGTQQAPAAGDGGDVGTWQAPAAGDGGDAGTQQAPATGDGGDAGTRQAPAAGDGEATGTQQSPAPGDGGDAGMQRAPAAGGGGDAGMQQTPAAGDGEVTGTQQAPAAGDEGDAGT